MTLLSVAFMLPAVGQAQIFPQAIVPQQCAGAEAATACNLCALAQLARNGNAAAEKDLLSLAVKPPSGDDAVRTVAIKGYLAAGRDADARARTMKAQLPPIYHDVVTLTVATPEKLELPSHSAILLKNGGAPK